MREKKRDRFHCRLQRKISEISWRLYAVLTNSGISSACTYLCATNREPAHPLGEAEKVVRSLTNLRLEVLHKLGTGLVSRGGSEEAIAQYQEALAIKPHFARARVDLGFEVAAQGEVEEAIGDWPEALLLNPNFAMARNNLGDGGERCFTFSIVDRALGVPPQGFAAPAGADLDPGPRAPSKAAIQGGEAPLRSAAGGRVSLLSLLKVRNPHFMRSGALLRRGFSRFA